MAGSMSPELLALLLGTLGLSGVSGIALWRERRAQQRHVIETRTGWVRAGRVIRYGPVGAISYGTRPQRVYQHGVPGAVGLTDRALVFDGRRDRSCDVSVAYESVRWIALQTIAAAGRGRSREVRALLVHYQSAETWHVASYVLDDPHELAAQLAQQTGLPLEDSGPDRADYGPADASRARQDVYGVWHPDRDGALYLAPDRLVFDWRDAIPLGAITRLDVITRAGLAERLPFSDDLLRVEYTDADDERQTVGLVMRHADRWADAISRRRRAPLIVHTGRKRKEP